MKLTSAQVERTLSQFRAEAIPDNHPVVPQLNNLFGEHTFFLDSKGLNIVEPDGSCRGGNRGRSGRSPTGRGSEYRQLEQWQSDHAGAARARADRRDRHPCGQALSRSFRLKRIGAPPRRAISRVAARI